MAPARATGQRLRRCGLARVLGCAIAAMVALACVHVTGVSAARLSDAELAGKQIYTAGVNRNGEALTALVGMARAPVPAKVVTCAGCHGGDGLGRPEGGLVPPPITWSALTSPRQDANGAARPLYDEKTFAQVLATGEAPDGYRWNPGMPRYRLSPREAEDLVAYLKRIDTDFDPGIGDSTLRIGTLLPESGPGADAARAIRAVLEARIADMNAAGGIYGRTLELVVAARVDDDAATLRNVRTLLDDDVFALVAPFAAGIEDPLAALAEEARVPVVGPFTVLGGGTHEAYRYTFHLFSGLTEQTQVLVGFGLEHLDLAHVPLAIVYPDVALRSALAETAARRCSESGCAKVSLVAYRPDELDDAAAAVARSERAGAVLFLGSAPELERFAAAADRTGWHPALLTPAVLGARAAQQLAPAFAEHVYLAYPTTPADRTAQGERELAALRTRHAIPDGPALAVVSSHVATGLFFDGLRRAGRTLSRERLLASLEGAEFVTGLSMPLRYGPQRRIGALGAYVMARASDGTGFRPASGWIRLQ